MLCYLKFHFKQKLCGEEHRYIASLFLFLFLKKPGLKNKKKQNKKNHCHELFNNSAHKNEVINILGF